MKSNVLANALTAQADFAEHDGVLKSGDTEVTLFVAIGQTMLSIDRVQWVKIVDDAITIESRADRYVFAIEDVRGLRVGQGRTPAGFPT